MKNQIFKKPHLIVLDFDGLIYNNVRGDYSINIDYTKIIEARLFFQELSYQVNIFDPQQFAHATEFILISRRFFRQKEVILTYLRHKGYKFDDTHFCHFDPRINSLSKHLRDERAFLIEYWSAKANLITEISRSEVYKTITVIEGNNTLCSMLYDLNFTVIQAQFPDLTTNILFSRFPYLNHYNSLINTIGEVL